MTADVVVAVDIGGTKTAAALVDRLGVCGPVRTVRTPARQGPAAVVAAVAGLVARVLPAEGPANGPANGSAESPTENPAERGVEVRAVGVGTAGVVDVGRGSIVSATDTFADWPGTPLATLLGAALRPVLGAAVPVHVQNDVDAFALGELRQGAARGSSSALVVAVGTGVGGSVIVDGGVLRGARHVAGELGHMPVSGAEHLRCPCGRTGHLEAIGSGTGLHRHYLHLGGDPDVADAVAVVALAGDGDAVAARAVRQSAGAVGRAVAGAVTLLDPEVVVLTGGLAGAGSVWWEPMEAALRAELIDVLAQVPVRPGILGGTAPLVGAAGSAWELVTDGGGADGVGC